MKTTAILCFLYLFSPRDVVVMETTSKDSENDELDKNGGIYKTVDKSRWRDLSDPWAGEDLDEIAPLKQDPVDKPNKGSNTEGPNEIMVSKEFQEFQGSQKQMKKLAAKLKKCQSNLSEVSKYPLLGSLTYFRQLVKAFKDKMRPLENEEHKYGVELMMFEDTYKTLEDLLNENSPDSKLLLDLITEAFQPLSRSKYAEFKGFLTTQNLVLFLASLIAAYIIHQLVSYPLHIMGKMVYLFLCVFVVSVCWEYYRMYKMALAEKTANIMKLPTPPEKCSPINKLSELDALLIWIMDRFTFADDECVKYHENLLVDPLWEVSPIVAISVCASRFLLEPMKLCAATLGQCFRLFFKEVPLQWQPVLFLTFVCLFVLFILTHAGLEIWTPLIRLGFKPRVDVKAIENENKRLLKDNQNLRLQIGRRPPYRPLGQAIEEVGELSGNRVNLPVQEEDVSRTSEIPKSSTKSSTPVLEGLSNFAGAVSVEQETSVVLEASIQEDGSGYAFDNDNDEANDVEGDGFEIVDDVMDDEWGDRVGDIEDGSSVLLVGQQQLLQPQLDPGGGVDREAVAGRQAVEHSERRS